MKSIKVFSLVTLVASAVMSVQAGAAVANVATPRVVVVQLQEVAQKSRWFMEIQKRVEAAVKKIVDEIKSLEQQFNQKLERLQTGSKDLNMAAQQKLQEELASLKGQLEVKQRNLQSYVEQEGRKAEEQLIKTIQAVCKKMGYDIVIPAAIYTKPEFDRTSEVIKQMDADMAATSSEKKADAAAKDTAVKVK